MSFPKFEIHRKDLPDIFNLILWGGMSEPADAFEQLENVKICTPGSCCVHEFNKYDVLPSNVGQAKVGNSPNHPKARSNHGEDFAGHSQTVYL